MLKSTNQNSPIDLVGHRALINPCLRNFLMSAKLFDNSPWNEMVASPTICFLLHFFLTVWLRLPIFVDVQTPLAMEEHVRSLVEKGEPEMVIGLVSV